MPVSIVVPQLGESVAEGTVSKWLKAVGERVRKEEPLVEIQTDKINVEIPSPAEGTLEQILDPAELSRIHGSGIAGRVTRDALLEYLQTRTRSTTPVAASAAAFAPPAVGAPAKAETRLPGFLTLAPATLSTGGPREEVV